MAKKSYIELKVRVIVNHDDGLPQNEIVEELDYSFIAQNDGRADIEDVEILGYEVKDVK